MNDSLIEISLTGSTLMEKILFRLPEDDWHGYSVESLWGTRLGPNCYRIENSPFFAKGVSVKDQVETVFEEGALIYKRTLAASGRSTYRILVLDNAQEGEFHRFWGPIEQAGCTYEQGDFGYSLYSVDVPVKADTTRVFALLEKGKRYGVWDFEEGHFAHSSKLA